MGQCRVPQIPQGEVREQDVGNMKPYMKCHFPFWLMLLLAGAVIAGEPSFDVGEEDRLTVTADTVDSLAVSGVGAPEIKRTIAATLAGKPDGTRASIILGTLTEGSSRWQVTYLKSIVLLDAQGRLDGEEKYIISQGVTVTGYRLIPWKNGVKEGTEKTFLGGRLREELPWKNGKIEGLRRSFFADGQVEIESQYDNGVANGPTRAYAADGSLVREGSLKQGKRDGTMTEYWPGARQAKRVVVYRNGLVTGMVREYYLGGKLKREVAMKDEAYHGEDRLYNEAGQLTQTRYWLKGDAVTKDVFEGKGK
jgi:antitoxin component YwqK of YwqJK toxin-antitoxin module